MKENVTMLMITEERKDDLLTFRLAGAIAGDWAHEFERCWNTAAKTSDSPRVIVELKEVTFVDDKGKEVLGAMMRNGCQLIAFDVLTKSIVEEIANESSIA
jgi:anti-anti-sigma regulatory factor